VMTAGSASGMAATDRDSRGAGPVSSKNRRAEILR
jgi:hypothetical protein